MTRVGRCENIRGTRGSAHSSAGQIAVRRMTESARKATIRAHIMVSGRVQGVGYRAFAARAASSRGLFGGVRNLGDGRVELEVEGAKAAIEALLQELMEGPPAAHVTQIETEWAEADDRFSTFRIWY